MYNKVKRRNAECRGNNTRRFINKLERGSYRAKIKLNDKTVDIEFKYCIENRKGVLKLSKEYSTRSQMSRGINEVISKHDNFKFNFRQFSFFMSDIFMYCQLFSYWQDFFSPVLFSVKQQTI